MRDSVAREAMCRARGEWACAIRQPERCSAKPGIGWA